MSFEQIKNYKVSAAVIFTAVTLALYLPFFIHTMSLRNLQLKNGENPRMVLPIYGSDSVGYGILADSLLQRGTLSLREVAPLIPDTFRTPGFPALLAIFKAVTGSYKYFPLLQIVFVIGTAMLVYKIGKVFSETAGTMAGLLYIFDPTVIFHALMVTSDTSFTFFLILSVYLLFFRRGEAVFFSAFDSGVLLGIATLIRPISTYLVIPLVLIYFFVLKSRSVDKKTILMSGWLFVASFILILAPWFVRNKLVADTWGLASVQSFNLFHYTIPEFVSFKRGVSPDDVRRELYGELNKRGVIQVDSAEIKNASTLNGISYQYLLSDPVGYVRWHTVKMVPFFLSSGIKNFFYIYNDVLHYKVYETSNENLTNFLMRGQFQQFFNVLRGQIFITTEHILLTIIFVLMFVPLLKRDKRIFVLLLLGIILYLALPTPPVAYSRFRIPAAPYMFILASLGFLMVKDLILVKIGRIK
ncbi:MAG: glycosyltransferase family 39 protein [Candidatus Vogelbacteria bacterium]|nr:glycosyltransferase family 39 protein [Candidatus Vogelbacteria bacterium]